MRSRGYSMPALNYIRAILGSLLRRPGFAVTSILILAIGIGLSTAVFTVARAVLLRRLPVKQEERIVLLWGDLASRGFNHYPLALSEAESFLRTTSSFQNGAWLGYEGSQPVFMQDGQEVTRYRRAVVSGTYFDVLQVEPLLGRRLAPADDTRGAAPVAVLSYGAWRERFAGDPKVLGRRLTGFDSGVTYTVVGVMPPGMDYPRGTELWTTVATTISPEHLEYAAFDLIGRLAPGASVDRVRQELTGFLGRTESLPWQREMRGVVTVFADLVVGDVRPALLIFTVAAALLLLITCANVATLLLLRGIDRVREFSVRAALGAGRARIVAQVLVENVALAVVGGAAGVLVAAVAVRAFVALAPPGIPRLDEIRLNGMAFGVAAGVTTFAVILFGIAPALLAGRINLQQVLRHGRGQSPNRRSRFTAEALVAIQVALAVMVLAAAGVIAKSLVRLEGADLSLNSSQLFVGDLALRYDIYDTPAKQIALLDQLTGRLEALPEVASVAPVVAVPFSGSGGWDGRAATDGQSIDQVSSNPMLNLELASPQYFATLGVSILRGRSFNDEDREGSPGVVILSQSAAELSWPGQNPIGRRLRFGADLEQSMTVVGVVPDTRYRDFRNPRATVYFPLRQSFFPFAPGTLAIRATGMSGSLLTSIRRAIGETALGVDLPSLTAFDELLDVPLAQPRLNAALLALFAASALLLSAVGLYGVMASMVGQRRRELALRQALGATPGALGRLVLRRACAIAGAGSLLGLVGVILAHRLVRQVLYQVSPTDISTMVIVPVFLLLLAAVASYPPARAATRIHPAVTLRSEG